MMEVIGLLAIFMLGGISGFAVGFFIQAERNERIWKIHDFSDRPDYFIITKTERWE